MSVRVVVFCAQVFLIKTVLGQCIGNIGYSYGVGNCDGFVGNNYGQLNPSGCVNTLGVLPRPQLTIPDCGIAVASSYGGSLNVQASSPIAPGSISVQSENQIQGPVSVYGTLPFLSAVALEGSLPTHGSGLATYQCGDGRVGILEENIFASGHNSFSPGSWGLATGINGFNSCVQSVPTEYRQSWGYDYNRNNGLNCGCGY